MNDQQRTLSHLRSGPACLKNWTVKTVVGWSIVFTLFLVATAGAGETVVKSPVDDKSYRYLELDNRLKVLLISDRDTDQAAAALDVRTGNGSDPDDWQGLAHFLEHMLFLGTDKYPEARGFQEFIDTHGGNHNAYTSFEHTNYYFNIAVEFLEPALDRFSRFFIDPTFDEVYVDRERAVVHSEYQSRKKNERRRLWDAEKQWLNPAHPRSRFAVGSLKTLRDRDGVKARDKLIEFYEQHYSSNIMALAVVGRESLDELESLVVSRFTQIPDRGIQPQRISEAYMNAELTPARLNTIPEIEQNSVRFAFSIPSTLDEYPSKPLSYIAELLGHEAEGSVYSVIKELGWAEGLSAGVGFMDRVQGEFSVRIQLTEAGLEKIPEIGAILFSGLKLIKTGIHEWRYTEQSKLAKMAFRFAPEMEAGRLAQSLAHRLQVYRAEDVLQGPYMMTGFDPQRIEQLLEFLNPKNVNIHVTGQTLETDRKTKYYGVDYALSPMNPATTARWENTGVDPRLKLPEANPYIPERLELLESDAPADAPEAIHTDSGTEVWYRLDGEFGAPRANFYFNIMSPVVNAGPRDWVLTELYVRMVNSQLKHVIYPAYLAEIHYDLYRHGRGISMRMSGFEDKQSKLLSVIIGAMANLERDENRFLVEKAALLRELNNVDKESPASQAVHEVYRLLLNPYWTEEERIAVLEDLQVDDVIHFVFRLFEKVKVTVLSHGDVSVAKTRERTRILDALLDKSDRIDHVDRPGIRVLDRKARFLRTLFADHSDSALLAYFQGQDDSREERARLALLRNLLESDFYTQLRTNQQAGYLVHSHTISIDDTPGLVFSVQSSLYSPLELNGLYDEFIADFNQILRRMDQQKYEQVKAGLIVKVLGQDKNLSDRSRRYWREIDKEEWAFESREKFVKAVNSLTLEHMREYYASTIVDRGGEILVQLPGIQGETRSDTIPGAPFTVIGSPLEFREAVQQSVIRSVQPQ